MILQKPVKLIKDSLREFFIDNCPQLSAAISFYSLLSLFPLTLVISSITGFIIKSPTAQEKVIDSIVNFLPVSGDFIASTIEGVVSARTTIRIAAMIMLILGGMCYLYRFWVQCSKFEVWCPVSFWVQLRIFPLSFPGVLP